MHRSFDCALCQKNAVMRWLEINIGSWSGCRKAQACTCIRCSSQSFRKRRGCEYSSNLFVGSSIATTVFLRLCIYWIVTLHSLLCRGRDTDKQHNESEKAIVEIPLLIHGHAHDLPDLWGCHHIRCQQDHASRSYVGSYDGRSMLRSSLSPCQPAEWAAVENSTRAQFSTVHPPRPKSTLNWWDMTEIAAANPARRNYGLQISMVGEPRVKWEPQKQGRYNY